MVTRTEVQHSLEAEVEPSVATYSTSRTERFVTFKLGGGFYALLAGAVAEVTHPLPLTPLPGRTPVVLGISPLRGDIIGILDIRRIVAEGPAGGTDPKSKQVVLKRTNAEAVPLAFTVDRLGEVAVIGLDQIRPAHESCEFLIGETETDGRVIKIIDHSKLPAAAEPDRPAPSI